MDDDVAVYHCVDDGVRFAPVQTTTQDARGPRHDIGPVVPIDLTSQRRQLKEFPQCPKMMMMTMMDRRGVRLR